MIALVDEDGEKQARVGTVTMNGQMFLKNISYQEALLWTL
jgi:hypothetical protein